jgi:uncharacterized protein (TIGR01244 family)
MRDSANPENGRSKMMFKHRIVTHSNFYLLAIAVLLSGCLSVAADDAVVAISANEIRNDATLLANHHQVSSGQPDTAVLNAIKDAGFVAVIDMRTAGEDRGFDEVQEVKSLGMQYISFPVAGAGDITFENASEFDRILAGIDGPVLVHCASGNRVGGLYALRAKQNGASVDEAMDLGKTAGLTRLEPVVREKLQAQ